MKEPRINIPDSRKLRVIIDTDCNCEADDQFAILHALMSEKLDVVGIVSTHFGTRFGTLTTKQTEQSSYEEVIRVLDKAGLRDVIPVYHGGGESLSDEESPADSEGIRFIIEEAQKEDPRPLVVLNQGALSDLASAILLAPEIAEKITAVWTGGADYPAGGWEFNLWNDIHAVNVVMKSRIDLWQIPIGSYSVLREGIAVLLEKVSPCGEIGRYLMDKLLEVNQQMCLMDGSMFAGSGMSETMKRCMYPNGESWVLGDNSVVGVLLNDQAECYNTRTAPEIDVNTGFYLNGKDPERKIRVYNTLDAGFILEDFYAKLRWHFT